MEGHLEWIPAAMFLMAAASFLLRTREGSSHNDGTPVDLESLAGRVRDANRIEFYSRVNGARLESEVSHYKKQLDDLHTTVKEGFRDLGQRIDAIQNRGRRGV